MLRLFTRFGALIAPAMFITACVAPSAALPTLAHQRDALKAARAACAQDLELLEHQVRAALDARATLLLGQSHRELIARGYVTPALEPDPAAFDDDLANPDAQSALLTEVRLARLTRQQAHDFLNDYALTLRMKREGTALRNAMLSRLHSAEEASQSRAIITESLAARRSAVLRLLDEAGAANAALDEFARRASPEDDPRLADATQTWRTLLDRLTAPTTNTATTPPATPTR